MEKVNREVKGAMGFIQRNLQSQMEHYERKVNFYIEAMKSGLEKAQMDAISRQIKTYNEQASSNM